MEQADMGKLSELLDKHRGQPGALIPVLQGAQKILGYLSPDSMRFIASNLKIPLSNVYGTATFYSQFKFEPMGKHCIGVCMGTACYVRGADRTLGRVSEVSNTLPGRVSGDGYFSLEVTRCVGACGLAPVVTVDGDVHGTVKVDQVEKIIEKYR